MTDQIRTPWTPEQVAALNEFQRAGWMHPFTCGNPHVGPPPTLAARPDGWRCTKIGCSYQQDWAHAFMADPSRWPKPFGERHGPTPEESRAAMLVQVGWYCWRCRAVNRMACRSDNVPVHVPVEWADEMRAEIARREDEDDGDEPAPPQDGPRAPQDGPQRPGAGAETPDGAGGRQAGADGREALREQYAAAIGAIWDGWIADWVGTDVPEPERILADAVLAVRDRELERLEKLHQAHLRVEQRLAGQSIAAEAAVEQIRLHIAAHRPRLQYADPILLGRLEAVLRQVGELEAAGGGPLEKEGS